jgi:anti-anti-sigma regulatory factor
MLTARGNRDLEAPRILWYDSGQVRNVFLAGEIDLAAEQRLRQAVGGRKFLSVDLRRVTFIDPVLLGYIGVRCEMSRGHRLLVSEQVASLLATTHMTHLLERP